MMYVFLPNIYLDYCPQTVLILHFHAVFKGWNGQLSEEQFVAVKELVMFFKSTFSSYMHEQTEICILSYKSLHIFPTIPHHTSVEIVSLFICEGKGSSKKII